MQLYSHSGSDNLTFIISMGSIRGILVLGTLAIVGLLVFQGFWLVRSWDLKEEDFHYKVTKVLHSVASKIAAHNQTELPKSKLITRQSSNFYSVNINSAIDANILEDYLVREFTDAALTIDFEYAVYDCANDEYLYSNFCNLSEQTKDEGISISHPKFEDLIYYFVVKFPSRSSLLIKDLQIPLLFSILTILSILSFMYAIWVILRQKQMTDLQKDFINNMTHEFKTPISSIKLASDYLIKDQRIADDVRLSKYSDIIRQQNLRLNHQVEKVLNIARLEKDQFKLNKKVLAIKDLVHQIVEQERIKVEEQGGVINFSFPKEDLFISADELHLTNVISNIVDNAIKYSDDEPDISLRINHANKAMHLIVTDTGRGIGKDDLKKIFNKFYRVSTGNVHNVKGFGLGLYYVKNICDAHNWQIQLDSTIGEGTSVTIEMPLELEKSVPNILEPEIL